MTRALFIRDCKENKNMKFTLVGGDNYEWIKEKRPQNLNPRRISKVQTNAIYLEGEENNGQGSYLQIPKASLMEYDREHFCVYDFGIREMTAEEKKNEKAAQKEREKYNKENSNSYSGDFWHMKEWYSKCSTPWISPMAHNWIKGKKRGQGKDFNKIMDEGVKGNLILKYKIEM